MIHIENSVRVALEIFSLFYYKKKQIFNSSFRERFTMDLVMITREVETIHYTN